MVNACSVHALNIDTERLRLESAPSGRPTSRSRPPEGIPLKNLVVLPLAVLLACGGALAHAADGQGQPVPHAHKHAARASHGANAHRHARRGHAGHAHRGHQARAAGHAANHRAARSQG
jgi:hypothetical protein